MQEAPIPYKRMVFVCINKRENGEACCADRGAEAILARLKEGVKAKGLARDVRVARSGCHDVCAKGPSVVVFPDNRWFYGVTEQDVDAILAAATAIPAPT